MLELEDFTPLIEKSERKESGEKEPRDNTKELEEKFRRELLNLQLRFEEEVEKAFKEGYEKGLKDGLLKAKEDFEERLKEREKELKEQFNRKLESISLNISQLREEFNKEKVKRLKAIERVILSSLEEVLEFLFINPKNSEFVAQKVGELIKEFGGEELVRVEAGRNLVKALKGEEAELNPSLGENDFRLIFKEFSVESSFREKLNLLREEIEREIKKAP